MVNAKRFFTVIITIVLLAIILANLYLIVSRTVFNVSMPKILGFSHVKVMSGSMEPEINVGDLLIVQEKDSYEAGDIVTYSSGNSLVTHRVIEVVETHVMTQGDANNTADPEVPKETIHGRVVLVIPKVGNLLDYFKTIPGLIFLTGVVAASIWFLFSSETKKE